MAQRIDIEWDISKRAHELYQQGIRAQVERDMNIGKILVLDVDTGNYEIDADGIVANDRLRKRLPGLTPKSLYAFRIGYDAVFAVGSTITRTEP